MPLFEQIGRKVRLAPAGMELLRYASQVMELLREAGETLAAMRGLKRGVLKLGAVSTAKYFAPSLLSAFTPAYPEVAIKFAVANREEIVKLLAANELDLVIMGRPPRELETMAEPFAQPSPGDHRLARRIPLARRARIPLKSLARESFIIREQGSGTRASMEHVFRRARRDVPRLHGSEQQRDHQAGGDGRIWALSFISSHTVGLEAEAGKLAILDVVGLPIVRDWYVIHLRERILSPIASAFRAFLLENGARVIQETVGDVTKSRRP